MKLPKEIIYFSFYGTLIAVDFVVFLSLAQYIGSKTGYISLFYIIGSSLAFLVAGVHFYALIKKVK